MFQGNVEKLWIGSLDTLDLTVHAQYNPKELQIDSPITWKEHESLESQVIATKPMEFGGMGAESMKIELLFDYYEQNDWKKLAATIDDLKKMASVIAPKASSGDLRRPHFCVVAWGGMRSRFECIIEAVSVKYTMFGTNGRPLRASVTLSLKSGRRPTEKPTRTSR